MDNFSPSTAPIEKVTKMSIAQRVVIARVTSHKKWKDSLEGSLDRGLRSTKLEFPKILVSMLSQHISDVNFECVRKSEWSKNCILYI